MDKNHVIGSNNDLPWRLPKDLRFFKEKTTGQTIIMGRKTFDSMNGPLPNRRNVILTKSELPTSDNLEVIKDIHTIYEWNEEHPDIEYFVIGGGNIFEQVIHHADRMYITWIDHRFQGDTYFPSFSTEDWILSSKVKGERNETNPYEYYFLQYDRK